MQENFLCGTSEITGCRFSIYPMTDRFVDVILSALKEVDTSKVWMETDDVSTCVRGRSIHVFDVVKAIYLEAVKHGDHVVFNGTFSNGCPGDTAGDAYLAENEDRANEKISRNQPGSRCTVRTLSDGDSCIHERHYGPGRARKGSGNVY